MHRLLNRVRRLLLSLPALLRAVASIFAEETLAQILRTIKSILVILVILDSCCVVLLALEAVVIRRSFTVASTWLEGAHAGVEALELGWRR